VQEACAALRERALRTWAALEGCPASFQLYGGCVAHGGVRWLQCRRDAAAT
jgi:hypothetical protein